MCLVTKNYNEINSICVHCLHGMEHTTLSNNACKGFYLLSLYCCAHQIVSSRLSRRMEARTYVCHVAMFLSSSGLVVTSQHIRMDQQLSRDEIVA